MFTSVLYDIVGQRLYGLGPAPTGQGAELKTRENDGNILLTNCFHTGLNYYSIIGHENTKKGNIGYDYLTLVAVFFLSISVLKNKEGKSSVTRILRTVD